MTNKHYLNSKTDFQTLFLKMADPLKPFYSEGRALLHLGNTSTVYSDHVASMEAFSRPLWGLAPYLAGGGEEDSLLSTYRTGMIHGTDPEHPEYWGGFHDYDQRFVEMAALSFALLMVPEKLWDPLSDKEKQNLVNWLDGINHYECVPNNWQFFCVFVNTALRSVGAPYNEKRLKDSLELIDSLYTGGGWYTDGHGGQVDYYIGFAIQFYSLIYVRFMEKDDPQRCSLYRQRAAQFARDFVHWFDENGAAVAYGRSLIYRFAQVSFFSACVWAGVEAFPLPVMKGLIVRHLEAWMESDAFDDRGILTLGYHYPNLHMCEEYNGPGSPYWSMKSFLFLALEDGHPFWKAEAAPFPVYETLHYCADAALIAQRVSGQAVIYPAGCRTVHKHQQSECKYSKFAYSSRMGFHISISNKRLEEAAPDNVLAFEIDGQIFVRDELESWSFEENALLSCWKPFPGITVNTTIVPDEQGHKRIHVIESDRACTAYDSGFSISDKAAPCSIHTADNFSSAGDGQWLCTVSSLKGAGEGCIIAAAPNTNLVISKAQIPSVRYSIQEGTQTVETYVKLIHTSN